MQRHFRIQCSVQQRRKAPHRLQVIRLRHCQCQNAAVVNQEYIVLAHIIAKCREWQRAVTNTGDKRVLEDSFTHCCSLLTQLLGKTHASSLYVLPDPMMLSSVHYLDAKVWGVHVHNVDNSDRTAYGTAQASLLVL